MSNEVPNIPNPKKAQERADELVNLRAMVEAQNAQIEQLKGMLIATQAMQAQAPSRFDAVAEMLTNDIVKRKESEEKFRNEELWSIVSTENRSQVQANEKFKDGHMLCAVKVGWCPMLVIRGHSREEAKGRYNEICGILGVNRDFKHPDWTEYAIADVTGDPEMQKLANLTRKEAMALPAKPRVIVPVP